MQRPLNDEEKRVLIALYDELNRNSHTSIIGIDETTLGYKVGAYLGIKVMYSVAHLEQLKLVAKRKGNVMITEKGIQWVKSHNRHNNQAIIVWLRDHVIAEIVVGLIIAFLAAMIINGWKPW